MTGILVNARMKSVRLPGKHLMEVGGKPIIEYLIRRMQINTGLPTIIVTGNYEDNRAFESAGCTYFGDDNNIPQRQLDAMDNFYYDNVVSVDGDDILCSWRQVNLIANLLDCGDSVKGMGLPFGMNAFGYSRQFLYKHVKDGADDYNWTTGWHFRTELNETRHANKKIRMSLDYLEDYEFFKTVIEGLGETIYTINDEELLDHIDRHKLYEINRGRK
jgi:spore coat polysaccharide biosynthesis protein SpsF (cytidylyltransferase family)